MMRPSDPRVRANLNRLNEGLESAAQTTQSYLYIASERASPYVSSCLESLSSCLEASCQPCFAARRQQRQQHHRRHNHYRTLTTSGRSRGGRDGGGGGGFGIGGFDFYDDWEEQEDADWGNDELERLLSGDDGNGNGGGGLEQPMGRKTVGMSYGSRLGGGGGGGGGTGKRKALEDEPNMVPQSSMFGFLESLPWKIGGRGSGRFKPGVADLQEGVGRKGGAGGGGSGVEVEGGQGRRKGRGRSGTVESRSTTNSLSSRGDLFPSDDEADAVPLDDEFAMGLDRRNTAASDEHSSGRRGGKRPAGSTKSSTKTASSKDTRKSRRKGNRDSSTSSRVVEGGLDETTEEEGIIPSMTDLKMEEERIRKQEEAHVEEQRAAAQKLARERGLTDLEGRQEEEATAQFEEDHDSKEASTVASTEVERPPATDHIRPPSPEMRSSDHNPDGLKSGKGPSPEQGANNKDDP